MKERLELLTILKEKNHNEIQTQFGHLILILHDDNAKQKISVPVNHFIASYAILHQTTCPHAPPFYGIAERKHYHIIEIAIPFYYMPMHH